MPAPQGAQQSLQFGRPSEPPQLAQISRQPQPGVAQKSAQQVQMPQPLGSRVHAASGGPWPQTPAAGSSASVPQRQRVHTSPYINAQQQHQVTTIAPPQHNYNMTSQRSMTSAPSTQAAASSTPRQQPPPQAPVSEVLQPPQQVPQQAHQVPSVPQVPSQGRVPQVPSQGRVPQVPTHMVSTSEQDRRSRAATMPMPYTPQRGDQLGANRAQAQSTVASSASAECDAAQIRFEHGEFVQEGTKKSNPDQVNQDVILCVELGQFLFAGVFDGHGKNGRQIAELTKNVFESSVTQLTSAAPGQLSSVFVDIFRRAQAQTEQEPGAKASGTTATAALLDSVSQTVTIAHVGDSAAIVGCGPQCLFQTEDHDFDDADKQRVESCGGEVREFPTAMKTVRRIYNKGTQYPALALARSIGDVDAHSLGVLADPAVSEKIQFSAGHLLVLASDGVWNVVSPESVLNVATAGSAANAAERVVQCARESWSQSGAPSDYIDDISAIVIKAIPKPPREQQQQQQQRPPAQSVGGAQALAGIDVLNDTRRRTQTIGTGKFGISDATPLGATSRGAVPVFGGMQPMDTLVNTRRPTAYSGNLGAIMTAQLPDMSLGTGPINAFGTGPLTLPTPPPSQGYSAYPQQQPPSGGIKPPGSVGVVPMPTLTAPMTQGIMASSGTSTPKNVQNMQYLPNFGVR